MSDKNRPPPSSVQSLTPSPSGAPSDHASGPVIVFSTGRRPPVAAPPVATPNRPIVNESQDGTSAAVVSGRSVSRTSTYGRPMDVHGDVQAASARPAASAAPANLRDETATTNAASSGRPMDVQIRPARSADVAARITRAPRGARKAKPQAALDERGSYRHTVRLDPKAEQRLRAVAEILGVDLNAAISVCIAVHFHRLTKSGNGDV